MTWYKDANLYVNGRFNEDTSFSVIGHKVYRILFKDQHEEVPEDAISLEGNRVVPGFIDQHIHGSIGYDFMDAVEEKNRAIAEYLPRVGVTSFLATTLTASTDEIRNALKHLYPLYLTHETNRAELLGVHLEGPYINPQKKGAHNIEWIVKPSVNHFTEMTKDYDTMIKMVSLAPECDLNHELIRYLSQLGIISSVGHSTATYIDVIEAHKHGMKCVTHCYNAMSGITSRDGGVLGAALTLDSLWAELISDGIHVSKENVVLYNSSKPDAKKILVSDAMAARGLEPGNVHLGGLKAYYDGEKVKLEDGTLAGSVLEQMTGIKTYMQLTGLPFEKIVRMLTQNPAELLGIADRKGSIAEGKDADFVVINENYEILMTVCKGTVCYNRSSE